MKGEHGRLCTLLSPGCLCLRCKHDNFESKGNCWDSDEAPCCFKNLEDCQDCPVKDCQNFEPDDEEEGDE